MKDENHVMVWGLLWLCASVDKIYHVGGKKYGRKTLHNIQGGRIAFLSMMRIMKVENQLAVWDFLLLCASVDNTYDIGGKQYGKKHYIIYRVAVFLPTEDVNNKRQKSCSGR